MVLSGMDYLTLGILILVLSCVGHIVSFVCLGSYLEKKKIEKTRLENVDMAFMQLMKELEDCLPAEDEEEKETDDKSTRLH